MYQSVSSRTLWPELCYSVVSYPANRNRFFSLKHDAIKLYFRSLVLDSSPTNMISILSYVRIVFVVVRFYPRRLTLSEPRSSSQENWALILYRRESGKRYLYFQILTRRITFTNQACFFDEHASTNLLTYVNLRTIKKASQPNDKRLCETKSKKISKKKELGIRNVMQPGASTR